MEKNLQVAFNTSVSTPPIASSPASTIDGEGSSFLVRTSSSSSSNCHGFWFDAFLVVPSVIFVVYLAVHAKKNLNKLCNGRSYIMISYYAFLWIASILNLTWCSLQAWQCSPGKEVAWNLLSLFTASGMLCLEISLVAFLLQEDYASGVEALARTFIETILSNKTLAWQCSPGKEVAWNLLSLFTASGMLCLEISLVALLLQEDYASGVEALARTFIVSGIIVGLDTLLKAIYVFGFGMPLFMDGAVNIDGIKWGLWIIHKLWLTAVYGYILFVHFSKWREKLPPRPAFYNYVVVMFVTCSVSLFACGLAGLGANFGIWLYNFTVICYHSLYLPFLYVTFLADFFQEEDFLSDSAYYSEMKDAGFFDADWD